MSNRVLVLIVLVLLGAAVVYYLYPKQVDSLLGRTPLKTIVKTSKPLYQWRDEQGQWHATDEPPPDGIPYEVKQYDLDSNVLPPYGKDKEKE